MHHNRAYVRATSLQIMLTRHERRCLDFIEEYTAAAGVNPTFSAIAKAAELPSPKYVGPLLQRLVTSGKLRLQVVRPRQREYFKWNDETQELERWQPK